MLWHKSVPLMWRTIAVLVPVHAGRVITTLDGTGGVRVGVAQRRRRACRWAQEPVQAAAAVLKPGLFLFLAKHFHAHRLKHPRVHQGLTQADGFVAWHRLIAKETVEGEVCQHHVHGLRAQEAVMVRLQVVASALDLHMSLEVGDDAAPDVGGSERLPSHARFWSRTGGNGKGWEGERDEQERENEGWSQSKVKSYLWYDESWDFEYVTFSSRKIFFTFDGKNDSLLSHDNNCLISHWWN